MASLSPKSFPSKSHIMENSKSMAWSSPAYFRCSWPLSNHGRLQNAGRSAALWKDIETTTFEKNIKKSKHPQSKLASTCFEFVFFFWKICDLKNLLMDALQRQADPRGPVIPRTVGHRAVEAGVVKHLRVPCRRAQTATLWPRRMASYMTPVEKWTALNLGVLWLNIMMKEDLPGFLVMNVLQAVMLQIDQWESIWVYKPKWKQLHD